MKIIKKDYTGQDTIIAENITSEEYGKAMIAGLERFTDDNGFYDLFCLVEDTIAPTKCYRCKNDATLLCDGRVRQFKNTGIKPIREKDETCDRPMCEDCAHEDNPIFFSGKDGGIQFNHYCDRCNHIKYGFSRLIAP